MCVHHDIQLNETVHSTVAQRCATPEIQNVVRQTVSRIIFFNLEYIRV
jgi:hypothetical protein